MDALCPHCFGKGCEKCVDGKIAVSFAKGNVFTRQCTNLNCGFENGGRIVDGEIPEEPSGDCVMCNSPTRWKIMGNK